MGWVRLPALLNVVSEIRFSEDVCGHTPMPSSVASEPPTLAATIASTATIADAARSR